MRHDLEPNRGERMRRKKGLQEAHDDHYVLSRIRNLEDFGKYFQRKAQYDTSDEVRALLLAYKDLMKRIDDVYRDDKSESDPPDFSPHSSQSKIHRD